VIELLSPLSYKMFAAWGITLHGTMLKSGLDDVGDAFTFYLYSIILLLL